MREENQQQKGSQEESDIASWSHGHVNKRKEML